MKSKVVNQDVYISIVLYAVIAFFFTVSSKLQGDSAIFPKMILTVFTILNTVVLCNGIKKTKLMRDGDTSITNSINFATIKVPLIIYSILVGYVIIFKLTNYFIATTIMLLAVMLYYRVRSWKVIASVIIVYNLFIYLLFVLQLKVPLL